MSARSRGVGWLRRDCRGSAAIEFALVGPAMLVLLLGTIELVHVIRIQAKLNVAAGQLVEMIAGQTSVTMASYVGPGGTLGDLCKAASYNLYPYKTDTLSAYIESTVVVGSFGLGTQQNWAADKSCPASRPVGSFWETILLTNIADNPRSLFTLDGTSKQSGTLVKGYTAISLQLSYVYSNLVTFLLGRSMTIIAVASARPRSGAPITCTYPSGGTAQNCPGVY